jgi:hypothetical protein
VIRFGYDHSYNRFMGAARMLAVFGILLITCGGAAAPGPSPSASVSSGPTASAAIARQLSATEAEKAVGALVRDTLAAFKKRDGPALAALAHPSRGVRFSPYAYLTPTNIMLSTAQLSSAFTDPTKRTWGITDGKGDPIILTFAEYTGSYIYARDFAVSPQTAYNKIIGMGNAIDNTADVFPNAILFEAYDPGPDPRLKDTMWQSIRLLFERSNDRWFLVGVVHGAWTI